MLEEAAFKLTGRQVQVPPFNPFPDRHGLVRTSESSASEIHSAGPAIHHWKGSAGFAKRFIRDLQSLALNGLQTRPISLSDSRLGCP